MWKFVRFCLVGVANTLVYYCAYRLFLLGIDYLWAHVGAWLVATLFSYFVNAWFTFKQNPSLKSFLLFPLSSGLNLVLSTVLSVVFVELMHLPKEYATVIAGVAVTPVVFLVAHFAFSSSAQKSTAV